MKILKLSALVTLALLLPWGRAIAHHGTATSYDQTKVVKVTGIVKEFWWRNPHSALFLVGKDESGKEVTYSLEMGSPVTLVRMGYTRKLIKPGDHMEVTMHPSRVNPTSGELLSRGVLINGKPLVTPAGADDRYAP